MEENLGREIKMLQTSTGQSITVFPPSKIIFEHEIQAGPAGYMDAYFAVIYNDDGIEEERYWLGPNTGIIWKLNKTNVKNLPRGK